MATSRRAGVLGRPIGHSLSPVIHNAGYAAARLSGWRYTAHECGEADLGPFVAGLGPDWAGLSLTMPLKEVALELAPLVGEVAPLAAAIGSANTLVRGARTWRAENTDAPGMLDALLSAGTARAERVAVLGAGGTARAALAAARDLGATEVTVYARRPEAVTRLDPVADRLGLTLTGAPWAGAGEAARADVVIATVPAEAADALAETMAWRPEVVLLDVVYDPWPTALAASASTAGCRVVSGLDLLLGQAARQFELFTGVAAPAAAMRAALSAAVRGSAPASNTVT